MMSTLTPARVPTRRTVLAVRCSLALVALVISLWNRNLIVPVLLGLWIWRWAEEWRNPIEQETEVERSQRYAQEFKRGRRMMALNVAIAVVCFVFSIATGRELAVAAQLLIVPAIAG